MRRSSGVGGVFAFAVAQKIENFLDFAVLDHPPQSHGDDAVEWNGDFEVAGLDIKEIVLFDLLAEGPGADLLDNAYAVVGIDNAVPNVEITVTVAAHTWNRPPRPTTGLFYPSGLRLTI